MRGRIRGLIVRVLIGIAALAVLLRMAKFEPETFVSLLAIVAITATPFLVSRPSYSRSHRLPEPRRPRRFQFSIRQIMAVAVFAAACSLIGRIDPLTGFVSFVVFGAVALYIINIAKGRPDTVPRGKIVFGLSKKERWAKIQAQPFPPEWSWIMARNVPIYDRLSELDKAELRGLIQVFLAEKVFEGCGGLEINDEIRVTIAAQACLLILRRDTDVYPNLITVLVYPSAYVSNMPQHSPQGVVTEGPQGLLGEAWTSGVVVLSWDDVKQGASDVRDGHNVVFHEFAHQLDQEDGSSDGAPVLPRRNLYSAWGRVLGAEYDELRKAAETGKKTVLDTYGATEPAEFFAVATEAFFEKPVPLKKKHPELYEELKIYYNQDPEADFAAPVASRPKL
jgi:Mlc titration factor MtfA (ptsG expression regulator)